MKYTGIQIRVVFLPFLIISILTISFYTLFRWFFDLKLGLLPLKEDLLDFWLPVLIPSIAILIWIRKRVRILNVKGKNDNGHFLYQFIMIAAIAVPIIIAQNYIKQASFKLKEIKSIEQLNDYKTERYFHLKNFEVDPNNSLPFITGRTSGKNNETLTFHLYLACPFITAGNNA